MVEEVDVQDDANCAALPGKVGAPIDVVVNNAGCVHHTRSKTDTEPYIALDC